MGKKTELALPSENRCVDCRSTSCQIATRLANVARSIGVQTVGELSGCSFLVISVTAGVSTSSIESLLNGNVPVIRAMPNTSCFVQASATAIIRGTWANLAHLEIAQQLFSAIGSSLVVDESLLDAVTGLLGTGPAYLLPSRGANGSRGLMRPP
jgi:hypothetical protein